MINNEYIIYTNVCLPRLAGNWSLFGLKQECPVFVFIYLYTPTMTLILVALYLPHRFSPAAAATSFAPPGVFLRKKILPTKKKRENGSGSGGKWTVQKTASSNLVKWLD